jgi:uncharacterized phage-associated protein
VEAWQWGPVLPSLYSEFKPYGSGPITEPAKRYVWAGLKATITPYRLSSDDPRKDALARQIVERIWRLYGHFSASELSAMTHEPNSPWSLTDRKEIRGTDIPDAVIADYFRKLAKNEHSASTVR